MANNTTTTPKTVSFDNDVLARAQQAATDAKTSLSAYVNRAVRKQVMADNLRRAADALANLSPEDQADLDAIRAHQARRMASLAQDAA